MSTPQHDPLPDEGMIHEWLDGQLDTPTSAHFEALVARSPAFAARVAEARGFVAASSRILSALDDVPSGVLPNRTAPAIAPHASTPDTGVRSIVSARPRRPSFPWQRWASAAAVLLVAVTGTMFMQRDSQPASGPAAESATTARLDGAEAASSTTPLESAAAPGATPLESAPASVAAARSASAPAGPTRSVRSDGVAAGVGAEAVSGDARANTTEVAEATMMSASGRGGIAAGVEGPAIRSTDVARAAAAPMARSLAAAPASSAELSTRRSDLALDDVQFAVQRVECAAQCRQVRVEIATDGRLRRWTSSLGRSAAPDTGHVSAAALATLAQLQDSLALGTLPSVVPLMGAQCRTVGSLRESLRLEFRHDGQRRAITALPWCDAPQHPLAAMARAVEDAAAAQLGALGAP